MQIEGADFPCVLPLQASRTGQACAGGQAPVGKICHVPGVIMKQRRSVNSPILACLAACEDTMEK